MSAYGSFFPLCFASGFFCFLFFVFVFLRNKFLNDCFQSCNKSLINQACSGPYWKNIGPRSFMYGPRFGRSLLSRPRADILPVRPSRLVHNIYLPNDSPRSNAKTTSHPAVSALKICISSKRQYGAKFVRKLC